MGFKKLQSEFEKLEPRDLANDPTEAAFRYWLLVLLFEINGNLDSIAVAARKKDVPVEKA